MERDLNEIIKGLKEVYKTKSDAEKGLLEINELRNKVIDALEYTAPEEKTYKTELKLTLDNKLLAMCQLVKELPEKAPDQELKEEIEQFKKENPALKIKLCKTCWGDKSYFGFVNGEQYTEDFYSIEELKEHHPEFKNINITNN